MAISSFPVLSHALDELGLLNSNLGRTVMSGALVADLSSWVLNAAVTSAKLIVKSNSPLRAMGSVGSLVVFVLFVYYVARPLILKELNKTPTGELVDEWCYLVSVLAALVAALLSETIGYIFSKNCYICFVSIYKNYHHLQVNLQNITRLRKKALPMF